MDSMVTTPSIDTPPRAGHVVLRWSARRTAALLTRDLIGAPLFAVVALDTGINVGLRIPAAAFALLLILATARQVWRFVRGAPALILDDFGFEPVRSVVGPIPWTGITKLRVVRGRRVSLITATLDPVTAASLVPRIGRRLRLSLGLAKVAQIPIEINLLDRPADQIVALFEAHRPASARARPVVDAHARHAEAAMAGRPWFAYALIALITAILVAEFELRLGGERFEDLTPLTLWALGASQRLAIVKDAQWWRLVTATLLHGGILHLVFNGIALWFAARLLERVIGWRWFAATFAVSAVCGSTLSMLWNVPNQVGVGASGGILGLSAATAVIALHFDSGVVRTRLLLGAFQILVPSLLPIAQNLGGQNVDLAAHLGGALGGAAMGSLLCAFWPRTALQPLHGAFGAVLAGLYFAVAAASAVPIRGTYETGEAIAALDPTFPSFVRQAIPRSQALVIAYPRDPRVRAAYAESFAAKGDMATATVELLKALGDKRMLQPGVLSIDLEPYLRVRLAQLMVNQGKKAEAAAMAQPVCAVPNNGYKLALAQMKLCR